MSRIEVLQGSHDVEYPSSSECAAVVRCDYDRNSVCDGFGMDGER